MKKLLLLLTALTVLLLTGCFDTSTEDSIDVDAVSPASIELTAGATDNKVVTYSISASEVVTQANFTITFEKLDGSDATALFTAAKSTFSDQYTYLTENLSTVTVNALATCPSGTYKMKITGDLNDASSSQKITVTVTGVTASITSVADATVSAGASATTSAVIANGSALTATDITVSVATDINSAGAPTATVSAYDATTGIATIAIDAASATVGTYTGTVTVGNASEDFTITVESSATALTAKNITLYNPYAPDGFNSAYNFVDGAPVAGGVNNISGKMEYASSDSLVADIAVDLYNDVFTDGIRPSKLAAELTSINGGMFKPATASDYDNATDVSLKVLCATADFTDNEAPELGTDDVYIMELANSRGYIIFKIGAIDENFKGTGFTDNTGSLELSYKYVAI